MAALLIGTRDGIFRYDGERVERDGMVQSARFVAAAGSHAYALGGENDLWRREGNADWECVTRRCIDDEVWSFATDPRLPGRLYLGVSPALLYRSDDGGVSWTACESIKRIPGYETWTFPPPPHVPHVRSIAPDPEVRGGVYIGVEEGGVFRSANGGESWTGLNEGLYWDVHTVTPTPGGERLYATTGGGFYRSDDGGCSWHHLSAGLDRRYTVAFAVDPGRSDRVYVAAAAGPPPAWRNGADAGIYCSDDGGVTWGHLTRGLPAHFDRMVASLVVDDSGAVYAASVGSLFGCTDGESWRQITDGLPAVQALTVL